MENKVMSINKYLLAVGVSQEKIIRLTTDMNGIEPILLLSNLRWEIHPEFLFLLDIVVCQRETYHEDDQKQRRKFEIHQPVFSDFQNETWLLAIFMVVRIHDIDK